MVDVSLKGTRQDVHARWRRALCTKDITTLTSLYCHYGIENESKHKDNVLTADEVSAASELLLHNEELSTTYLYHLRFFDVLRECVYIAATVALQYEVALTRAIQLCAQYRLLKDRQAMASKKKSQEQADTIQHALDALDFHYTLATIKSTQLQYVSVMAALWKQDNKRSKMEMFIPWDLQEMLFSYKEGRDYVLDKVHHRVEPVEDVCAMFDKILTYVPPLNIVEPHEGFMITVFNRIQVYERQVYPLPK